MLEIERTKSGLPALWEQGGGYSNTGYARVVCSPSGGKKKATYVRRRGQLANGKHSLVVIDEGDVVVLADHHREDFEISIMEISKISANSAETVPLAKYSQGQWDNPAVAADFAAAVDASKEKATCYHCGSPHYISNPN